MGDPSGGPQKVSRTTQQGSRRSSLSRHAWLTALTAILVFLVALGSRRSFANLSDSGALLDVRVVVGDLLVLLGAVVVAEFCLLAYLWVSYLRSRRAGTGEGEERTPSTWAQRLGAGLVGLLLFAIIVAIAARRGDGADMLLPNLGAPAPLPFVGNDNEGANGLVVHWWALLGVAILGLLAILSAVLVRRRRRRREIEAEDAPSEREELLTAVEASLEGLEEDPDARQAVINAYASLEQVLARHGLARRPSEAPLEYLARWTDAVRVSRSPAEALTRLYERARFSLHLVDEAMRREATSALLTLRLELGEDA
jgi:phosphatidylglycerophosphate synthase